MKIRELHPWPKTTVEAKQIQKKFRDQVIRVSQLGVVTKVAGVDIGFEKRGAITRAAVAVLSFPQLELIETKTVHCQTKFPYIPGYLSFREVPAALLALRDLKSTPDLILCDGQGLAHPRRFGLACHLGLLTDTPTIGVAKSRLIGSHEEVPEKKGSWQPLIDQQETIGAVLRTRSKIKPLYISIGHRVDLRNAIDYTLRCSPKYRLPETTRWADKLASRR